ncbi:CCA tRNA nucleotidyltransferase [Fructilactobacillus florum]|uniref:CCA-adding enzyme n=1 Tax=Fructilactobacillus florum DSM 22689 = JCM 16035 TaxID=1423745 RepID=A0A0R2CT60_9LACO|nr:CCA tRNA nucleotidyltransferase [Fructilactobacillus florum]KRM91451.1 tRNA CCA-pyrophosphorylase [Fructilactobacillus florum DSM 22689 = JCM 16035]
MQIKELPPEFLDAKQVLQKIEQHGYQAYFVGGCVRDTLLHKELHDVDLATSAYPAEIKQIFPITIDTGIEHGTITVRYDRKSFEITTFRTESGYQDYRRPDQVTFVRSLKEDLQRRDFTINALAMTATGDVIDLFSGLRDLDQRLIKAVGDPEQRFQEDALRLMRAVRFGSQLDFCIEKQTLVAMYHKAALLEKISIERINAEFSKMMLGQTPMHGLEQMIKTKILQHIPVLSAYEPQLQQLISHVPAVRLKTNVEVWTLLAVALRLNSTKLKHLLRTWKNSNQLLNETVIATQAAQTMCQRELTAWELYQTGWVLLQQSAHVALLYRSTISLARLQKQYQKLPIKKRGELHINGKSLLKAGFTPGPNLGQVLEQLEKSVVAGELPNDTVALLKAAQKLNPKED